MPEVPRHRLNRVLPYSEVMSSRLRSVALLGAGSLALHQLRYRIAYGEDTPAALAREGHGYLDALAPLVALLVGAAVLDFVLAIASRGGPRAGPRTRWIAASLTLLAVYLCQESLEGLLAGGHPSGLAAMFANGGWVSLPLAGALGAVLALAVRGADAALARRARGPARVRRQLQSSTRRPPHPPRRAADVHSRHLAARAPPRASLA